VLAAILLLGADAGSAVEPVAAAEWSFPGERDGIIAVELNRAEPLPDGCRVSFVIQNRTTHAFESLLWDLFFFDPDGLIAGRLAAEAAPLPAGKTSVKLFDIPGLMCDGLSRVLLNDTIVCETEAGEDVEIDCLQLTVPSSRADIGFIK
jgi:hypothetical protein